jgi:hypothetical protein
MIDLASIRLMLNRIAHARDFSNTRLEKELKAALDDLAAIRKAKPPSEKRNIGIMLRAALGNARYYLSELVDGLKE